MRARYYPLSVDSMRTATFYANKSIEKTRRMLQQLGEDAEHDQRMMMRECKTCFYLRRGRIAGQAFTNWHCGICGKQSIHSNTGVPKLCTECSLTHKLCTECGGDIDLRVDRKDWPTAKAKEDVNDE